MHDLRGAAAVVTGGASGIGRGIALELARRGVDVAIADLHEQRGEETAQAARELGVRALFAACDVTSDEAVKALHGRVREAFGRVDILVNNAGVLASGTFEDIPIDAWRRCLDVNLLSCVRCTQIFLPDLRAAGKAGGGHIVNTSSLSALFANEPMLTPYAASKAALVSLSETLAVTLRPDNIGVTCLCPGAVPTNIGEHMALYGEGGDLGVFAAQHVPARSSEYIGRCAADAIINNTFLVTSHDDVQEIQKERVIDPDGFVSRMAKFFFDGTKLLN